MKIVIPGGSGQVGTLLARDFHARGHDVTVISRTPASALWKTKSWDALVEIDGSDVVINLAGRSVNCRYSPKNRREIMDSRVLSTRAVGEAISRSKRPPRVWLQASTATIYAHRYDAPNDEATGILGSSGPDSWKFSTEVAAAWEQALDEAYTPSTRKVSMRSAMTMSPDRGGIFHTLFNLVRRGLGGKAGDGRQFISWIHDQDFVRAVLWLIEHESLEGPVNLSSPAPLSNAEFMGIFREAAGAKFGVPSAAWMLEIGAFFMRTETELILKSRRVVPQRLLDSGFQFLFPTWPEACQDLCTRFFRVLGR